MKKQCISFLKKIGVLSLALSFLTACSGGGNEGSGGNTNKTVRIKLEFKLPEVPDYYDGGGYNMKDYSCEYSFDMPSGDSLYDHIKVTKTDEPYDGWIDEPYMNYHEDNYDLDNPDWDYYRSHVIVVSNFLTRDGHRFNTSGTYNVSKDPIYSDQEIVIIYMEGKYRVVWSQYVGADQDDIIYDEQWIRSGEVPTYNGKTKISEITSSDGYRVKGWRYSLGTYYGSSGNIGLDEPFVAPKHHDLTFEPNWGGCEVIFKNYDGEVLQRSYYVKGETPTYNGDTPTRESTDKYSYNFIGWVDNHGNPIQAIGDNMDYWSITYTAKYETIQNYYTVQWFNYDGTLLESKNVNRGEAPQYTGETPTKASDELSNYIFIGWDNIHTAVYSDQTYTAVFEEVRHSYRITWANYDGTVIDTTIVKDGNIPSYTGSTPSRSSDSSYDYTFTGWSPSITAAYYDVTYTAQYSSTRNSYTVTFKNYDGTILQTGNVSVGVTPSYTGSTPTKPATDDYTYEFKGWSPELAPVTADVIYTAQFEEHSNYDEVLDKIKLWTTHNTTWTNGSTFQETIEYNYSGFEMSLEYSKDTGNITDHKLYTISIDVLDFAQKGTFGIRYSNLNERYNFSTEEETTYVNFTGTGTITSTYSTADGVDSLEVQYATGTQYSYSNELNRCKQVLNRLLSELKTYLPSKCGISITDLGFKNV